ncbi:hypothetical protein Cgig2_000340 [Carnegiea gigantea]|uniref:SH2 domain-containing protein n=1 Tax=Carnegiea gigantea TaxID=171969 RepID=A0A9Q1GY82_9CARY|nr:hypothetical protein Cgig2_000340 [Carnegiea gigantea]
MSIFLPLQLHSKTPFLCLRADRRIAFSPPISLENEDADSSRPTSLAKAPSVVPEEEFPLERWVHLGCEVSGTIIRICFDGKISGERSLDSFSAKEADFEGVTSMTLSAAAEGNKGLDGYVYNAKISSLMSSIENQHDKDPPLRLSLNSSSAADIEVDSDGVWTIVGGKASCRRYFSFDILLLNAFGELVEKELEVVASLVYATDRAPVEKSEDGEAPLLTSSDGFEFPSDDRPTKLLHGRASFKLKISQLSSKCHNRLFCIKFDIPQMRHYPFLMVFSPPIRCISRTSNSKMPTITWKKLPSGLHLFNGSNSPKYGSGCTELQQSAVCEARLSPPSKRVKLGRDNALTVTNGVSSAKRPDEECNSYTVAANKVQSALRTSLESLQENYGGIDNSASDSESVGTRNIELKNVPCSRELISDLTIFRYCLGGLSERLFMLKEISLFVSEQDMIDMAEQVSLFSGCSHHRNIYHPSRYQIMMTKRLLEEEERAWNLISQDRSQVHWDNVVFEIEEHFMRIACSSARSLSQQDLNFLRKIPGGREYITRDDFDKIWRWLYPVAFTISRPEINVLWASASPKWIEEFVTKEEVEYALQGIQEPGTFILRFPTSRSWPHPDAGSLIASYVGTDFSLHHRQLSLDYRSVSHGYSELFSASKLCSGKFDADTKSLQELLLSEPELSRVGRVMRSDLTV